MNSLQTTVTRTQIGFDVLAQTAKVCEYKKMWEKGHTTTMTRHELWEALTLERRILMYMRIADTAWLMSDLGEGICIEV